jgi:hypothetical protein
VQLPVFVPQSRIRSRLSTRPAWPAADNPEEQEYVTEGLHGNEGPDLKDAVRPPGQDQEEPAENPGDGYFSLEQIGLIL